MITGEKLGLNLKELKRRMPLKPKIYTPDHPKNISQALRYYCNQRTVHTIQAFTFNLSQGDWPLPLWFDPNIIRVGFWNRMYCIIQEKSWWKKIPKKLREFDFLYVIMLNHLMFGLPFRRIIIEAFEVNDKFTFHKLLFNPVLGSKKKIIESLQQSYNNHNWLACIYTIFPVIDFVSRKFLRTNNLSVDVLKICKLFEKNGFSMGKSEELMPFWSLVLSRKPISKLNNGWIEKMQETDFGLIGPALFSFIKFANIYYSYYKEDKEVPEIPLLNRHAILHGSINEFGNKENVVKLITFLYLILELEEVFKILLAE